MKLYNVFEILTDDTKVYVHNIHDNDIIVGVYDGRDSIPQIYNNCDVLAIYTSEDILQIEIDYEYINFDELDGLAALNCLNNYVNYIDQHGVFTDIDELIYQVKETLKYTDYFIDSVGEWYDIDGDTVR
jgi:hypothetical protein